MKCDGPSMNGCPHKTTGKGVKKYYDKDGNPAWQCEKCALESNAVADLQNTKPSGDLTRNELLCFLTNSWPKHSHEEIKSICCNFYTEEEIKEARRTIFDHFTGDTSVKKIHTESTRKVNYINDIIHLLTVAESGQLPVFVSVNLHRIPCMTQPPASPSPTDTRNCTDDYLSNKLRLLESKLDSLNKFTHAEFSKVHADIDSMTADYHPRYRKPRSTAPPPNTSTGASQPRSSDANTVTTKPVSSSDDTTHPTPSAENATLDNKNSNNETSIHGEINQHTTNKSTTYAKVASRVIGTGVNKSGLKVSPKPHQIYVGCLDADTKPTQLIDYVLTNIGIRCSL